jgi:hypothetical protein
MVREKKPNKYGKTQAVDISEGDISIMFIQIFSYLYIQIAT